MGFGSSILRAGLCVLGGLLSATYCEAGMFGLSHFVGHGDFNIGVEPEFWFAGNTGVSGNIKYTQGISDLSDLIVNVGTGGGGRLFRLGGTFTFDIFPEEDNPAGFGVALNGLYVQIQNLGAFELTVIPYIHKTLKNGATEMEPFLGLPMGVSTSNGNGQALVSLAFGSLFKHSEHFSTVVELGLGFAGGSSYLSGGVIYYH